MDARLVGRVIDTARTVTPLLAVSASALDLGQPPATGSVRAQVAARLADGTFRVLIDGKALKLSLPADVKPGDVLQLRVVARAGDAAGAANSPASPTGSGVSTAGQLVADLVRQPPAAPTRQTQPVLDLPPEHSEQLPAPLARAVERSGLFYESHQARWVRGDYPLERLMQEPQASAGKSEAPISTIQSVPIEEDPSEPVSLLPPRTPVAGQADDDADFSQTRTAATQDMRDGFAKLAEKATDVASRETLNIVRQQIDALETRHIQWLGEIWPGQTMRWEIGEGADDQGAARDSDHAWDSSFVLDLPALGSVGAELVLAGSRLRIRVSAQDEQTAAMMRDAAQELIHALEAAGIATASFEVQHREPAP